MYLKILLFNRYLPMHKLQEYIEEGMCQAVCIGLKFIVETYM